MNAQASRKLALSLCLQHIKPFTDKVEELLDIEMRALDVATDHPVKPEELNELNKHILQRKALENISILIDELAEELHEGKSSEVDSDDK